MGITEQIPMAAATCALGQQAGAVSGCSNDIKDCIWIKMMT